MKKMLISYKGTAKEMKAMLEFEEMCYLSDLREAQAWDEHGTEQNILEHLYGKESK